MNQKPLITPPPGEKEKGDTELETDRTTKIQTMKRNQCKSFPTPTNSDKIAFDQINVSPLLGDPRGGLSL